MRRARVTGESAVYRAVKDLVDKFEYPDLDTLPVVGEAGGGGGMAHVLIVSTSEPPEIQAKADYVVRQTNSANPLQDVFDIIEAAMGNAGHWTIWMAGVFDLDDGDVTFPTGATMRGLGWYDEALGG